MIRINKIHEGSKLHLFVEGTLSDGWVEALETSWLEARSQLNGEPLRIDLSDISYVDDRGRELLARMIQSGAKLRATGIMTRAVVEEIKEMLGRKTARPRLQSSHRIRPLMKAKKSTSENFERQLNRKE